MIMIFTKITEFKYLVGQPSCELDQYNVCEEI